MSTKYLNINKYDNKTITIMMLFHSEFQIFVESSLSSLLGYIYNYFIFIQVSLIIIVVIRIVLVLECFNSFQVKREREGYKEIRAWRINV